MLQTATDGPGCLCQTGTKTHHPGIQQPTNQNGQIPNALAPTSSNIAFNKLVTTARFLHNKTSRNAKIARAWRGRSTHTTICPWPKKLALEKSTARLAMSTELALHPPKKVTNQCNAVRNGCLSCRVHSFCDKPLWNQKATRPQNPSWWRPTGRAKTCEWQLARTQPWSPVIRAGVLLGRRPPSVLMCPQRCRSWCGSSPSFGCNWSPRSSSPLVGVARQVNLARLVGVARRVNLARLALACFPNARSHGSSR